MEQHESSGARDPNAADKKYHDGNRSEQTAPIERRESDQGSPKALRETMIRPAFLNVFCVRGNYHRGIDPTT
jgi:hypothetical protein